MADDPGTKLGEVAKRRTLRLVVSRSQRSVTALVVLLLVVSFAITGGDAGYFQPRIRQTDEATRAVRQAHEGMLDQETGVRGYLLSDPAGADRFLQPYTTGRAVTATNLAIAVPAIGADPDLAPLLRATTERAERWQESWAGPVLAAAAGGTPLTGDFQLRGKALFDSYRSAQAQLIEVLKTRKDDLVVRQTTFIAAGLGLALLASILVFLGVRRQHRRLVCATVDPLDQLAATVHRIRDGELDLAAELAGARRDDDPVELAALAADVHDMAQSIRDRDADVLHSRRMLVQAQRLAGVGSWSLEVETRALTWSDELYAIKGVDPGTPIDTELMASMFHPDDLAGLVTAVRRAATGGGVHPFDHRLLRADGEIRYIAGSVEGELDADGRPWRVTGISQDVTERRAAEAALTESEARYRLLADNSSDIILRHSPDGTIRYVSPSIRTVLGLDPDDLAGTHLHSLVHPDDVGLVDRKLVALIEGSGSAVSTLRTRHADGHWVWTESLSTAVRAPDGTLAEVHTATRDITDRMAAEEALRRQAIVFESIRDSVLITDACGVIVDCNAGAERLSGYSRDELIGHLPGEHRDPAGARRNAAAVVAHLTEHSSWRGDVPFVHRDGSHRLAEAVTVPLRDHDGVLTGMIDVSRDVTAEREADAAKERAAQAMAEARDAALAATAAKSAFLATMSHEIRTPMNAVIGMTGLLLDTDLDPQQRDFVETVRTSGDALLGIINDILDFSKIEAGELELEREPFALRDAVETALDLVAAAGAVKGLDLVYHVDPACPPHVVGDVTRLRQVLANLLSNAVKFTERGDVLVSVVPAGDLLRFTVTDTGIGIPADRMDRLFRSFSQVDASTTRVHGGTGLGLAISRALVEAMGGELTATSTVGAGSEFTFTVALDTSADVPVAAPPTADLPGRSALVVDDNPTNRRILRRQLESWGMTCTDVETPGEAIALVRAGNRYDIALLDMTMPGMDGAELAERLHALPAGRDVPRVLLTSIGNVPAACRFAAYLTKPVKTAALRDVVARALGGGDGARPVVARSAAAAAGTPLRILIAEDNAVNQKVGQLMLRSLGHRADLATNGREALEAVLRQSYDVVLMDIQMPEMDGIEATRRIRTEVPADRQPRIVAVTASALIADREACAAAGMDGYLPKPIRAADLADLLAGLGPSRPGTAAAAGTEPVDPAVLDELVGQLGDAGPATRRAVLDSYLVQGAGWVGELVTAAHAADGATVSRIAHTLQSSSQIVGALPLAELLRAAEETGRSRGDLVPGATAIEAEYHRVAAALEALRGDKDRP